MEPFYLIVIGVVVLVFLFMAIINRYRRCPSDKILVIYGNRGNSKSAKCVHGGGAFVWPIIEDYAYLSLTPIGIDANLTNALSKQNIRVDVPCRFTVGISTEPESMLAAAERLLGQTPQQIQELARDILFGQLRLVIATMSIEELNSDRDKFLEAITANVEVELKKIGLRLINVNVTDIKDESGYIEALGQEAAAKAINEAKVRVAEQERNGEIGKAEAVRETRIRTAEASGKQKLSEKLWLLRKWQTLRHSKRRMLPSRKPRVPVPTGSVPANRQTSSWHRKSRRNDSSLLPRLRLSRSVSTPKVRLMPSSRRWKLRQKACSKS